MRCWLEQDTFLDAEHLRASFPGYEVEFQNNSGGPEPVRPFRITFPPPPPEPKPAKGKRKVQLRAQKTSWHRSSNDVLYAASFI